MAQQLRLFEFTAQDRSAATLLLSDSNQRAWDELSRSDAWPLGVLVLTGPAGAGKSHMAHAWAERTGARVWAGSGRALEAFEAAGGKLVLDDADRFADEPHLALLLDAARSRPGSALLLAARRRPDRWPIRLVDLRSRLVAAPLVELQEPDDELLAGVLKRLCRARFIKLTDKTCNYLVHNMERSFAAAHALAEALDTLHVAGSKPVSLAVAGRALRSIQDQSAEAAPAALAEES